MPRQNKSTPHGNGYKIALIDIETAPNISYTWGTFDQNVIAFQREWYILCFAVRWLHEKKTVSYALPDFKLYKTDPENDRDLVKKLWEIFDQADLLVAHNGVEFDFKKANSRFLVHGFPPPSPAKTVDTLKIARQRFAMNRNRLNDLSKMLGVGEKIQTGGFDLWLKCMAKDKVAWEKMCRYCRNDVDLLLKVYERLAPWHPHHPNITLASGESFLCPSCGSADVQRRGALYLQSFIAQRYQCKACGRWSSGPREKIKATLLKSA